VAKDFEAIGLDLISSLNSGKLIEYSPISSTVNPDAATRDSSHTSFIQKAMQETNIKLYQTTTAKRILFDKNKKATGV
jgi:choline dehydrogenase